MINRREFLIGSAVLAGAARGWGQTADRAKMDRVAVMSYSFDLIMKSAAGRDDPQRTLDILDFPDEMAQRYGIHNLEIQQEHFRSTEPDYLGEFKNRLTKAQSRVTQLVLELGAHNISTTDPAVRSETIELTNQWIDRAVFLSAARVMINQGTLAPDVRTTAAETLKTIKAYADAKKVMVTVENRDDPPGYVSSTVTRAEPRHTARPPQHTWEDEVQLIRAAGSGPIPTSPHSRTTRRGRQVCASCMRWPQAAILSTCRICSTRPGRFRFRRRLDTKGSTRSKPNPLPPSRTRSCKPSWTYCSGIFRLSTRLTLRPGSYLALAGGTMPFIRRYSTIWP